MRLSRRALLVLAVLLVAVPLSAAKKAAVPQVRVLFIGNSLTYVNDVPALFAEFAKASYPDLDVVTGMVAAPGETLKGHWDTGKALQKIQGERWDYVVLQEQGAVPTGIFYVDSAPRHQRPEEFFDYGERFAAAAVAAKAKPVFYQTFERQSKSDDLLYLDYAYMTLGRKTGALVAPVGRVWHQVRDVQGFNLYQEDGHPTLCGSYLAAATIAATLFGDVHAAESAQHPAAVPEGQARQILDALRAVRTDLARTGGYADGPAPDFGALPSFASSLPLDDPALAGSWSAKDNALELSFGSRLTLSFEGKTPKIELVDYTLHAAFALPISDLGVDGNVIRFEASSQNRTYHLSLARSADGLEMLVERSRGRTKLFTHVPYRRNGAEEDFAFLEKQYEEISHQPTQETFDAALLRHYEALSARIGADKLSRILMNQSPLGSEWWSIMTAWEYRSRQQNDKAVRFNAFAAHQFPQSADAFQHLSEGLEAAGRIEEAYSAIVHAESLAPKPTLETQGLIAKIQEDKARLEKLRQAAPAGT